MAAMNEIRCTGFTWMKKDAKSEGEDSNLFKKRRTGDENNQYRSFGDPFMFIIWDNRNIQ